MRHPCNLCSLQFATEDVLKKHLACFHIKPDASRIPPVVPVILEKIKIEPELIRLDEEEDDPTTNTVQNQSPKAIFEKTVVPQIVKRVKPKDCYQCEVCLETFSLLRYFRKHLVTAKEPGFIKCQEYYKTNINYKPLPVYNKTCTEGVDTIKDSQTIVKEQSYNRQRTTAVGVETKDADCVMMKSKIGSKDHKQHSAFIVKRKLSNNVDNNITFQRTPKNFVEFIRDAKCAGKAVNDKNFEDNLVILYEKQSESSIENIEVEMPVLNITEIFRTPQFTSCQECWLTCASYEQLCIHYNKHHNLPVVVLKHVDQHELYRKYAQNKEGVTKNNRFKCETCTRNFSSRYYFKKHTASGPCANCDVSNNHLKISKTNISSSERGKPKSKMDLRRKNIVKYPKKHYELRKNKFPQLSPFSKHTFSNIGHNCWECNTCKRHLSSSTMLRKHKCAIHNDKKGRHNHIQQRQGKLISNPKIRKRVGQVNHINCHPCNVCHQEFSTQLQLTRHKVTAHQQNPLECDLCQKKYSNKYILTFHKLTVHEKFRFKCDVCHRDFSTKSYLKQHKRAAHEGFRHKCEICLKEFEQLYILNRHILFCHSHIRHKCELCPKEFALLSDLTKHKKISHDVVRHKCESCPKAFTQLSYLSEHKRSAHDGVRHKCESCPKAFTQLSYLSEHKRSAHDGVRHKCESCPKTFTRLGYLHQHKRSAHDGFCNTCGICQKNFCTSGYLKQHKITVHHV